MPTVLLAALFSLLALLWLRSSLAQLRLPAIVSSTLLGLVLPLWVIAHSIDEGPTASDVVLHVRPAALAIDLGATILLMATLAAGLWRARAIDDTPLPRAADRPDHHDPDHYGIAASGLTGGSAHVRTA